MGLLLGSSAFAQSTEVDSGSVILHMDFTTTGDLAGKQTPQIV
jgi:hypothetical protein